MAVTIREVGFIRVGAHSHIKGLGLKNGKALMKADGMVGQIEAREAAGIIVELIKQGKMAGRGILLAGPPGTGKTAIAVAIAKELGEDVPFIAISGSEIYSSELKKTEVLMQAMRKAIGVRIHEFRKVYEGMVSDLDLKMTRHPYNPYQQIPESAKLKLKTKSEEKTLTVGSSIAMELISRGISVGDVIWIDAETGRVTKLGKCKDYEGPKYDIEAEAQVPMPEGAVLKEKEFVYTITLHDLDVRMHSRSGGIFSLLFGGREEKEIPPDVRQEVDNLVKKWVDEGRAEIIPGVMFIDEASALDIEAFSFLGRAMEGELAPIIILATNRGITKIRGTDIKSPHGIPLDILDRLMIITTRKYEAEEIREILKIRASEEGVKLSEKALEELTKIGEETSLRYVVQMLTPAQIVARRNRREEVLPEDVEEVRKLFADVKQSTKYLKEHEEEMLK
ncbi:MAG: TATA box-binding protein [Candidatus Methanomethylicota archaeon]|nr:MAG: TATA box-binding protein [Candidatus Verstraetearchaeota archaeon]